MVVGYINYIEFLLTFSPNDAFINSFYFWWTNSYYVVPFLSTFYLFLVLYFFNASILIGLLLTWILHELWLIEFWSVLQANAQVISISTLTPQVNILLTNALNKYHPFIFYTSLFLLLVLSIQYILATFDSKRFNVSTVLTGINLQTKLIIFLNFTALYLGSWWAFQEGTWGGWWNWDPSEVFGLTPTLTLLTIIHSRWTLTHVTLIRVKLCFSVGVILVLYLMTQLNFELISHNFGPKFFYFFNSNLFSVLILMSTSVITIRSFWSQDQSRANLPHYVNIRLGVRHSYFRYTYLQVLVSTMILLWVGLSYGLFFEYVLFSFFQSATYFVNTIFQVNSTLFITFLVLFSLSNTPAAIPITTSSYLYGLLNVPYSTSQASNLHYPIILFTLVNLFVSNSTLFNWIIGPWPWYSFTTTSIVYDLPVFRICDSWNTDVVHTWSDSYGIVSTSWVTSDLSNIEATNRFLLFFTTSNMYNYYTLALTYVEVNLTLSTPLLPSVSLLSFLTLYQFVKSKR